MISFQRSTFNVRCSMFALAMAIAIAGHVSSAEIPLEHYLPEDTWLTVSFESLSDLTEAYNEGELPSLLEEDKLGALLAPLKANPYWAHLSKLTVSGEPLTWEMFVEKHPGRAVLAFYGDEKTFHINPKFHFLAITDYVGDIEFIMDISTPELSERSDIEIKIVEEDYFGTTLYLEEIVRGEHASIESGWTVVKGLYIEATPVALLKETVDLVLDGTHEESLAENPVFIDAQSEWDDSQVCVFMNLAAVVPIFKKSLQADAVDLPPNPLGVSMSSMVNALALENMSSLYAGLDSEKEGIRLYYGMLHSGLEGMLSLLSYTDGDLFKTSFVPPDAVSASVSNFSITKAWHGFEAMMSDMSPNFDSFYEMQLDQLKMSTNVDIRESIIENFGEQFIMLTLNDELPMAAGGDMQAINQCYALEIRDSQSFEMALEAFKDMMSQGNRVFESREFMGTTIHSPIVRYSPGVQVPTYSYAIKDGYFLFAIGSVTALEPIIRNMEKDGEHLLGKHDIQDALEQLPANPNEVQYNDIGQLWKNLIRNVGMFTSGMGDLLPLLKLGEMPKDVELPYFFFGGTYLDDNRLSFEALIKKKSDKDD